jgi:hypothetical protein
MTKNYRSLEHMIRDVMVETIVSNAKGMRQGHVSAGRNEYSSFEGGHSAAMARVKGQEKATKREEEESKEEKEKEIKRRQMEAEEVDPDSNTEARKEVENVSRLQKEKPSNNHLGRTASITNVLEEPTMFDKNFGLSKSLIDATRSIMEKDIRHDPDATNPMNPRNINKSKSETKINPELKRNVNEASMCEACKKPKGSCICESSMCKGCGKSNTGCMCEGGSGFNLAAMSAAERGEKSFTHGGKTFPVTAKRSMKESAVNEAMNDAVDDFHGLRNKDYGTMKKYSELSGLRRPGTEKDILNMVAKKHSIVNPQDLHKAVYPHLYDGTKHFPEETNLFSSKELAAIKAITEGPMGYGPPKDQNENGMNDTSKVAAMSDEETENPLVKKNTKEHPGRATEVQNIITDVSKKIFGKK